MGDFVFAGDNLMPLDGREQIDVLCCHSAASDSRCPVAGIPGFKFAVGVNFRWYSDSSCPVVNGAMERSGWFRASSSINV